MKKNIIILLAIISFPIFSQNENNPRFYNRLAFQAYNAHDYKDFLKYMKHAYELSNTHQSYIYNLAIAYLFNNNKEEAISLIKRGLNFGFVYPLDKDEDLSDLKNDPGFEKLLKQNLSNQRPMNISTTVAKLPAKQVIAEGLAKVIKAKGSSEVTRKVKEDILELTKQFPLYPGMSILK